MSLLLEKFLTQPEVVRFIFDLRDRNTNLSGNTCFYAFVILLECLRELARARHVRAKGRYQSQ